MCRESRSAVSFRCLALLSRAASRSLPASSGCSRTLSLRSAHSRPPLPQSSTLLPVTAARCLEHILRYVKTEGVCIAFLRARVEAFNYSLRRVDDDVKRDASLGITQTAEDKVAVARRKEALKGRANDDRQVLMQLTGQVRFLVFTVTFYANLAHKLTRSP